MKLEEINQIIKDFENSSLRVLELTYKDVKLRLSKNDNENNNNINNVETIYDTNNLEKVVDVSTPTINMPEHNIKSPLVGNFYAAPDPNSEPFVSVGDKVSKGDVLCIIEAMKIMNEITSPYDGIVTKILHNDGDVVGFDDVIMVISDEYKTE